MSPSSVHAAGTTRAELLRELVSAAILAPSGDNLQPWQFEIDDANGSLTIHVDPTRDASPMNAGQRMARIAVGAAVENVVRTVFYSGGTCEVRTAPDAASVRIAVHSLNGSVRHDPVIAARVTNRRRYDRQPISREQMDEVAAGVGELAGARAIWVTDRPAIDRIAGIVRRADRMLFGISAMRRAFFENVRFDAAYDAEVDWGLSLGSLEVARHELPLFRSLPKLPDWLFRLLSVARTIGAKSAKLVRSSSGLCVITAAGDSAEMDFAVGQVMQQCWLRLTESELAAQPMSSLFVLAGAGHLGLAGLHVDGQIQRINALAAELREVISIKGHYQPRFMLRFGSAAAPSARTGRDPSRRCFGG